MDHEVVPVPTARGLIRFEDRLAADIRIVSLPPGRDPDEEIRESPSRWAQLIARAKPVMDYYFDVLTADLDLGTARGKAEAVRALGPLILEMGDRVQRTHYLQQLARMVQVDEREVLQQIRQATDPKRTPRRSRVAQPEQTGEKVSLDLDEHCLAWALYYPELLSLADGGLQACEEDPFRSDDLSRPEDRAILQAWRQWLSNGGTPEVQADFYDTVDESLQDRIKTLVDFQAGLPAVPEDLLRSQVLDDITRLRLRNLRRQNRELRFLQDDAQASGDRELFRDYVQLSVEITARIRHLEQSMNQRSVSGRRRRDDATVRGPYAEE
jgi:DNA primase